MNGEVVAAELTELEELQQVRVIGRRVFSKNCDILKNTVSRQV